MEDISTRYPHATNTSGQDLEQLREKVNRLDRDAAKKNARDQASLEVLFGITLAIFAAFLAINDLVASRYGDDEIKLSNEKTASYLWYQSKGIKESLAEGQKDLVEAMLKGGAVSNSATPSMEKMAQELDRLVSRYKSEKREILLGSRALNEKDWVQDVDGKLGLVIGSKEIEQELDRLGHLGDRFDLATLALQLSLVMGAIGLTMRGARIKLTLYTAMLALGIFGASVMGSAILLAM